MLGNCGYFLSSVDFALEISAEWSFKQFGFSFIGPDLVPDCLQKKFGRRNAALIAYSMLRSKLRMKLLSYLHNNTPSLRTVWKLSAICLLLSVSRISKFSPIISPIQYKHFRASSTSNWESICNRIKWTINHQQAQTGNQSATKSMVNGCVSLAPNGVRRCLACASGLRRSHGRRWVVSRCNRAKTTQEYLLCVTNRYEAKQASPLPRLGWKSIECPAGNRLQAAYARRSQRNAPNMQPGMLMKVWAATWYVQQCGMCDQQGSRAACVYAMSDQNIC